MSIKGSPPQLFHSCQTSNLVTKLPSSYRIDKYFPASLAQIPGIFPNPRLQLVSRSSEEKNLLGEKTEHWHEGCGFELCGRWQGGWRKFFMEQGLHKGLQISSKLASYVSEKIPVVNGKIHTKCTASTKSQQSFWLKLSNRFPIQPNREPEILQKPQYDLLLDLQSMSSYCRPSALGWKTFSIGLLTQLATQMVNSGRVTRGSR